MLLTPARLVALSLALLCAIAGLWWLPVPPVGQAVAFDPSEDVCIVAPPTPFDAGAGIALDAPRPVPTDARCPVCGMFPARHPEWAAQVIYRDGATHFFDSPVSLLVFLAKPDRFSRHAAEGILAVYITDAASGRWSPAHTAFTVHGSNALGPMRNGNLPAFAERAAAERFAAERGGKVLMLEDVDAATLRQLANRSHDHG